MASRTIISAIIGYASPARLHLPANKRTDLPELGVPAQAHSCDRIFIGALTPMTTTAKEKHGYDGYEPKFMPARDITAKDRLTGKVVRETPDGPQNVNCDRIEWLFAHGKIDARQHAAATRFQNDWHMAQLSCFATLTPYGGGGGGIVALPNDAKVAAMRRHGDALEALSAREAQVIDLVVIQNIAIKPAAETLRVNFERVSERLDAALDTLATHYRIKA